MTRWRFLLFTPAVLLLAGTARPQGDDFRDAAYSVVGQLKHSKVRTMAVADLNSAVGADQSRGHIFALMMTAALNEAKDKGQSVRDHMEFDKDLIDLRINTDPQSLKPRMRNLDVDVVLTGSIKTSGAAYILELTPALSHENLSTISEKIRTSALLESLLAPLPPDVPMLTNRAHSAEINMPSCLYCPDPQYSDPARKAKIKGTTVLQVVISPEGRAAQIQPTKLLGYGLDEKAYEAIKGWKFKPAIRMSDGQPVAVIVPVEVSFRLY